jgi:hypothetical protein
MREGFNRQEMASFKVEEHKKPKGETFETKTEALGLKAETAGKQVIDDLKKRHPDHTITLTRQGVALEFKIQKVVGGTAVGEPMVYSYGPRIPLTGDANPAEIFAKSAEDVDSGGFQRRVTKDIETTITEMEDRRKPKAAGERRVLL